MSDTSQEGIYTLTAPVIAAHNHLFEAKPFMRNGKAQGEPKFGANLILDPSSEDFKAIKALVVRVAHAKWPGRDLKELKFPISDGTKLADKRKAKVKRDDAAFQRGKAVIAARSKYQPKLACILNGKMVDVDSGNAAVCKPQFYNGVQVLARINFKAYDEVGTNPAGVTAYLDMLLSTGKGERINLGASASDVFKGVVGQISNDDPTAGGDLDDQIAF